MRQPNIGHHRAQMFALSPEGVLMVFSCQTDFWLNGSPLVSIYFQLMLDGFHLPSVQIEPSSKKVFSA
jgi:hypothetical protein